jgi:energy-coupling factor transporter ATP-binding protein EcfA2
MDLLRDLHRGGATICMVTHDERYARHAERSINLFDGRMVDGQATGATGGAAGRPRCRIRFGITDAGLGLWDAIPNRQPANGGSRQPPGLLFQNGKPILFPGGRDADAQRPRTQRP